MSDPVIEDPLPGDQAFEQDDEISAWSQAAQVVGLGLQLTGHANVLSAEEAAYRLQIPKASPLYQPFPAENVESYIRSHLNVSLPFSWHTFPWWHSIQSDFQDVTTPAPRQWWEIHDGLERRLAPRLHQAIRSEEGDDRTAAAVSLLHISQFSRHQIVRVTAASSLANLRTALAWPTIEALAEGCSSPNDTIQQIAVDSLLRVAPDHPVLTALREEQEPQAETGTDPAHTSVIVPGTWSRFKRPSWWRPAERLFAYLQQEPGNSEPSDGTFAPIGNDLYDRENYYRWGTRLDGADRTAGARELAAWATNHRCPNGFSKVFAHSHGGNVALLAAARHELKIDLLVLIATPPHERTKLEWEAIAQHVKRIVALKAHFDFVVLLDVGWSGAKTIPVAGSFPSDRVRSLPVPVWFSHSVLTRPEVWTQHHLAHEVAAEFEISQS